MKILRPKDTNAVFSAPKGTEVMDLPGSNCRVGKGSAFYSLWLPSESELALLVAGHPVMVGILNDTKPIHPIVVQVAARKDRVVDQVLPGDPEYVEPAANEALASLVADVTAHMRDDPSDGLSVELGDLNKAIDAVVDPHSIPALTLPADGYAPDGVAVHRTTAPDGEPIVIIDGEVNYPDRPLDPDQG